jgi:2-isopropylmalate synthase
MKAEHKLDLPRRLQIEFSRVVQQHTDSEGGEVSADAIWRFFRAEYLARQAPLSLDTVHTSKAAGQDDILEVVVDVRGHRQELTGQGNGPIAAFCDALASVHVHVRVLDYAEHALSSGGDAMAAAYVECEIGDEIRWGVGLDANIVTASLKAVVSAVNRVVV